MHASRIPANCYCFQGMIITTGVERRESLGRSRAVMQRRRARACRVLNLNLNLNGTAGDNLVYGCRYPSRALLFLSCRRCAVASMGAWWCSVGDPGPRGGAACAPARHTTNVLGCQPPACHVQDAAGKVWRAAGSPKLLKAPHLVVRFHAFSSVKFVCGFLVCANN